MSTAKFFEIIDGTYEKVIIQDEDLNWRKNWVRESISYDVYIGDVFHISEVLKNIDSISNFIYDKKSETFFCNVNTGYHFLLAKYILHRSGLNIEEDYEDYYVMNNMGMILSSISNKIMLGESYVLTAQEKIVFNKMPDTVLYRV